MNIFICPLFLVMPASIAAGVGSPQEGAQGRVHDPMVVLPLECEGSSCSSCGGGCGCGCGGPWRQSGTQNPSRTGVVAPLVRWLLVPLVFVLVPYVRLEVPLVGGPERAVRALFLHVLVALHVSFVVIATGKHFAAQTAAPRLAAAILQRGQPLGVRSGVRGS